VKIIRGVYKNISLFIPPHTRIPSLRVKKSLFDMIKENIENSIILDLFAGSGSLGIEALSLGAKKIVFVEIRKKAVGVITKNLSLIKALSKAEIYLKDVFRAIRDFYRQNRKFNIIFLDPPYYKNLALKTLQTLDEYDILAPHGLIVSLCFYKEKIKKEFVYLSLINEKFYGDTQLLIYGKKGDLSGNF